MNASQFKAKWSKFSGKESAAYQEHFNDLCRLLGQPTPVEADSTGETEFCFQKRVVKDAELFVVSSREPDTPYEPAEHGFADVWKKDCFAWEYKGKRKNLDEAYQQLLRYREALLNPPLLVVCDFDRYIVRTNFNGAVQRTFEFANADIDRPANLQLLRAAFTAPDSLRPDRTTRQITEDLAARIAGVARSLQSRECVELSDAKTRRELHVAQKRNLRIAQFLNRLTFCFFAEDTGLLPKGIFGEILKGGSADPLFFAERLEDLFRAMAGGGSFGPYRIRHFNGHLFEDATVFELTPQEIADLADAAAADWQCIEPSIFGTLFERALDADQRTQLGAHYTSAEDIQTLVEPVLMAPLRREWAAVKRGLLGDYRTGKGSPKARKALDAFLAKLRGLVVLDPACGSGNFLYLALQSLLGIEKEVIAFAAQLGFHHAPGVGVHQLRALEINPYAFELAQVSVQIGLLQWMRDNGFTLDREPVLRVLDGFRNCDALLAEVFRRPRKLKEAKADEHTTDDTGKGYTEREWPDCDVIVSNPPFLGDKMMRRQLGDDYVTALRAQYEGRVPGQADLCCYWFEKARALIADGRCRRAGLLATQGIRGGANREVLKRIKASGDMFWAESDRPWILAGANVHVSMVGFGPKGETRDGDPKTAAVLDGEAIADINANLTGKADSVSARILVANANLSFIGASMHGPFPISEQDALAMLRAPNPHGRPNSDAVRPWVNGLSITRREESLWIVDFPPESTVETAAPYEAPFEYVRTTVKPVRDINRRAMRARNWWLLGDPQKAMRAAVAPLDRYLGTARVAKHRLLVWFTPEILPTDQVVVFARSDDWFFGVLQSRFHRIWSLAQGTQLREKESGFRYTPTTCFETFPFPGGTRSVASESGDPDAARSVAAAAADLNELRERWLNPPEWTRTEVLDFPGTAGGLWGRYIVPGTERALPTLDTRHSTPVRVGTVRYPRLVPRDADSAARLKKRTLTNLYNERPSWLDHAHRRLDEAVAAAYGWPADLTDDAILDRLLTLNRERAESEAQTAPKPRPANRPKRDDELI